LLESRKASIIFLFGLGLILCSCIDDGLKSRKSSQAYGNYIKGLLYDRSNQTDQALQYYRQVQGSEKDVPALYFQIGFDYLRLKKFEEAAGAFESVIRLTPQDDQARYILALVYAQLNEIKKSADQYEILLEKKLQEKQSNIQLRLILSQLYFFEKDFSRVKDHCKKILEIAPLNESAFFMLAIVANEEGRFDEAIAGFKEILSRNPESADAMNSLAYLYAEQDMELEKALELAEKAVRSDPSNGSFVDTLGWVYFKLGETEKAFEYLKTASVLLLDPVILDHLAQVYHKKGMGKEARENWLRSLRLDPSKKEIREKLKNLK